MTTNQRVGGSNPSGHTNSKEYKGIFTLVFFRFSHFLATKGQLIFKKHSRILIIISYVTAALKNPLAIICERVLLCAPSMGDNLAVKVRYRLGSRNC